MAKKITKKALAKNIKALNKEDLLDDPVQIAQGADVEELAEDFISAIEEIDDAGDGDDIPKKILKFYNEVLDFTGEGDDDDDDDDEDAAPPKKKKKGKKSKSSDEDDDEDDDETMTMTRMRTKTMTTTMTMMTTTRMTTTRTTMTRTRKKMSTSPV
jgi:hypothetical protein